MGKTLESGEIDALVCGPCTLPANAINELSADALCKECQAKLRKVAEAAAAKAARLAREDFGRWLRSRGRWLPNLEGEGEWLSGVGVSQEDVEAFERGQRPADFPASLRQKEGKG